MLITVLKCLNISVSYQILNVFFKMNFFRVSVDQNPYSAHQCPLYQPQGHLAAAAHGRQSDQAAEVAPGLEAGGGSVVAVAAGNMVHHSHAPVCCNAGSHCDCWCCSYCD